MKNYERILDEATNIALATSVDGQPNVRIVNFCRDPERPGVLYFSCDRTNEKVLEFAQNDRVAFTTVPKEGLAHVRGRRVKVRRSERRMDDVKGLFLAKIPSFADALEALGDLLDVYELHVEEAFVVLGFDAPERMTFQGANL